MGFSFYGWRTASVTDDHGLTPRDYYLLLSGLWSKDTCAPRMRAAWTPENRTLGQCSITAFLIQDLYGGRVLGVPLGDGSYHCFNDVNGCVFDLTSEQFGDKKLDYGNCPVQERAVHFAKAEKRERYETLRDALMNIRPFIRPMSLERLPRYGKIYAAAFSGEPWNDPWKPEDAETHVREILESTCSYGLEYERDGEIAAFLLGASMLFHYGRAFEINDLAVDPAFQGQGIASVLLEHCKADMAQRGIAGLHLITGAKGFLPDFYERHGFRRENRVILMGMEL